ncbi:hypothetical protein ES703_67730 [subsurface metagenome]
MTTEGKGSVLKTALGLENLKGLGDRLNQIKEFMGQADELQKTLGELAKENSPLSRALANLVEAEGIKSLNEGNVNVSEEVRKTMAEELKNKEKTIEELGAENKDLKEDKVISEVTSKLTAELDRRLPQPGSQGNDSGGSKLFKAIEDVVAKKLEQLLGGGESTLTSDQIRSVIREEVAQVAGGSKKPEDMVDDLVNALTMGDKLREKLGVAGIGGRLLQSGQGGDSSLRTDLVKVLLEDQRETLKIDREHEAKMERNKHLGTIAGAVKENLGDFATATMAAVNEIKAGTGAKTPTPAPQEQLHMFTCGNCKKEFAIRPEDWPKLVSGELSGIPCPHCQSEYTREQLMA